MSNTCDSKRKPWLKLSEAKDGMIVKLDAGFECYDEGVTVLHKFANTDQLFFHCGAGLHYIEANDDGYCIGIYPTV